MEHTVFLTQILGCIVAALVVAVLWCHSRIARIERALDETRRNDFGAGDDGGVV